MKKEYLIIIVIAALAAIWFFFLKKKQTVTPGAIIQNSFPPVAAPASPAAIVNGPPATMATATAPSQTLAQPAVTVQPSTAVSPVASIAIDSTQYDAIILPWMNSLGVANKQQALSQYPNMTNTEKAALADIIANVWTGKRAQTPADTNFWNTWRVKYHILDGTYSPFNGDDAQIPYAGKNNFDDPQTAYNMFLEKGASSTAYNSVRGRTVTRKR